MWLRQFAFCGANKGTRFWCTLAAPLLCLCVLFLWLPASSSENDPAVLLPRAVSRQATPVRQDALHEYDPLQYIPADTVKAWHAREFVVVFGIPSEDIEGRRRRRYWQRTTCWQYDGVATKKNKYSGSMLVLYVLGRSPLHQHRYSQEMLQEAEQWHDVVALDLNEANKSNKEKSIGVPGYWGFEASLGISFKTFRWLDLALRTFPRARYVAKGDDDMFLRVPRYLADFRVLPPGAVYWGKITRGGSQYFNKSISHPFAFGPCITLGRSAAEAIVFLDPLRRLAMGPYNKSLSKEYLSFSLNGDDGMIAIALALSGRQNIVYVKEACRFVLYSQKINFTKVHPEWIMVHHIREEDYAKLMEMFAAAPVPAYYLESKPKNHYRFLCSRKATNDYFGKHSKIKSNF